MENTPSVPSNDALASGLGVESIDRRSAMRKLAVGGAIVWSAPLISRTAFAAGPTSCTNNVINWNNFTAGNTFTSAAVGGVTATLEPSVFYGGTSALSTNRTIRTGPQGGVAGNALRFEQTPIQGGGQDITISFSQTVYSVSFTITDIDNQQDSWSDRVTIINPTSYTFSVPTGSSVIGAGTASGNTATTGRFRNSDGDNNFPNSSNAGNIDLLFAGPLTSITIRFACSSQSGGANQLINILNVGFCS